MAVKLPYNEPRTKGYFQNTQFGLFLPFQFNPTEMTNTKVTNYSHTSIPGLDYQSLIWTYGGEYVLGLKLSFDHRPDHQKSSTPLFTNNKSAVLSKFDRLKGSIPNPQNLVNVAQNTLIANIPGSTQIQSAINTVRQITGGMPKVDLNLLDTSKYLTVDDKEYNEDLGVLPQIAVLQSFLRSMDPSEIGNRSQYKLGNLQSILSTIKTKNNTATNRKLIGPPDCFFQFGNRVWRTRLLSAPINELIYNQKLVPVRIDVEVSLFVIESFSYQEYLADNATRLSLAFSLSDQNTIQQSLGNSITF
jgi:hypothetical protein